MTFQESIKTCFNKYADFNGRASRSEFWWFVLFTVGVSLIASLVFAPLSIVFGLAVILPSLSVGARRLHDTGRSGWWQLIGLIPVIGLIIMVVFMAQEGKDAPSGAPAAPGAEP